MKQYGIVLTEKVEKYFRQEAESPEEASEIILREWQNNELSPLKETLIYPELQVLDYSENNFLSSVKIFKDFDTNTFFLENDKMPKKRGLKALWKRILSSLSIS